MTDGYGPIVWMPVVATVGLWLVAVGVTASVVSTTWADLVGLLALTASPVVYRALTGAVGYGPSMSDDATSGSSVSEIRAR